MDILAALCGDEGTHCFPLFVHAHPDDETLQTGPLLAWCATRRVSTDVVTCTRGERGELVPGVLPAVISEGDLVKVRQRELAKACKVLGVNAHYYLGTTPARVAGEPERAYRDSGMRWIAEGLAGPASQDDPGSFTAADIAEPVADLVALVKAAESSVLVSYDAGGSYGHPDHVRAHEITREAARLTGMPMVEVASTPGDEDFEWFDFPSTRDQVIAALGCYPTQLSVRDDQIVHVGGQLQEIPTRIGLRVIGEI